MNWSEYKFHASSIGDLMTNDRSGKNVGETCKKLLLRIWIEETYGREKDIDNKYMDKGTLVEEDSITLYAGQRRKFYKKNVETFENEYFVGTPDIISKDEVIDIKSSWSLFTFYENMAKKIDTGYEYQLQAYMALTGIPNARLAYVLVNTPISILEAEKSRFRYRFTEDIDVSVNPAYVAGTEMIEKNGTFDDIPENERWMDFKIASRPLPEVYDRIDWARLFLGELTTTKLIKRQPVLA